MKESYHANKGPRLSVVMRVSAIIIMTIVWILIDKGNIYGQSSLRQGQLTKQELDNTEHHVSSPMFKDGDGARDGDLPIEGEDENGFVLKPNPVEGELVFDFEFTVRESIPVEVYDPLGKLIQTGTFEPGISSQKLDFSRYPTGMYIVRLNIGSKMETRRVIKK